MNKSLDEEAVAALESVFGDKLIKDLDWEDIVSFCIAGHQSAERKSAAKGARIAELEAIVAAVYNAIDDYLPMHPAKEFRKQFPEASDIATAATIDRQKNFVMTRELVVALRDMKNFYDGIHADPCATADPHCWDPCDCGAHEAHVSATNTLFKFKDEIAQLGREQNGASSKKLMGGME